LIEFLVYHKIETVFLVEIFFFVSLWWVVVSFFFKRLVRSYERLEKLNMELSNLKNYWQNIILNVPIGILVVDEKGRISDHNYSLNLRLSKDDLKGEKITTIFPGEKGEILLKNIEEVFSRGHVIKIHGWKLGGASDQSRFYDLKLSPLTDFSKKTTEVIVLVEDVTEAVRLQKQLLASRKLATVAQLMGGVAHRLKNPLASIMITLENFSKELKKASIHRKIQFLDILNSELNRLNKNINDFLNIAKPSTLQITRCDLRLILKDILNLMHPLIQKNKVEVKLNFDQQPQIIEGDREKLREAFLNIIKNSVEAMPTGGVLELSTSRKEGFLEIIFKDQGCGIAPKHLPHVFDFYYTTKKQGAGVGLSVVSMVVEQHAGDVKVESKLGKGTKVFVKLPLTQAVSHEG